MCGLVGLHLRNPYLYPRLGEFLTGMLGAMQGRGADSAGVAVYGNAAWVPDEHVCLSLLQVDAAPDVVASAVGDAVRTLVSVRRIDNTLVLSARTDAAELLTAELLTAVRAIYPNAVIAGFGHDLAVLKGVGRPRDLASQWGLATVTGWQGVGHTRMATESAVTAAGAHPYAVGPSQCLVHNGSFANHATIRRELISAGVEFDSENDTEVGARFVAAQLASGKTMEAALSELCATFDGFYTLVVSDRDSFAVVRDSVACKPAIIAETLDWVAMASEYRALSSLPGIVDARIWEPEPEVVYAWTR